MHRASFYHFFLLIFLIQFSSSSCTIQEDEWVNIKKQLREYNEIIENGNGEFGRTMELLDLYRNAYDAGIVRPDYPLIAEFRKPDNPDLNRRQFLHFFRPVLREANVTEYGAVGDGRTLNTDVINRLIKELHEEGGGSLFFPPGVYMSGSIQLRSNVHFYMSEGATLRAAPLNIFAFDPPARNPYFTTLLDESRYHYMDVRNAFIWGDDIEHVSIYGGTIDASSMLRASRAEDYPIGGAGKSTSIRRANHMTIKDVHFYNGGHMALQIMDSENVTLAGIRMRTSRDGIQLFGVRNVEIYNSDLESIRYENAQKKGGDDALVFKSMYGMNGEHIPTDGVIVRDTRIATNAFGLHFGSETTSDFRNIRFENIQIDHGDKAGISITVSDGAIVENIHYENITMRNVGIPIWLRVVDRDRGFNPDGKRGGTIKNITMRNIRALDVEQVIRGGAGFASSIVGQDYSPIENIVIKNAHFTYRGGGSLDLVDIYPPDKPEHNPDELGIRPGYAFYIRHAKDIEMHNIITEWEMEDRRPAMVVDHTNNIYLNGFQPHRSDALNYDILTRNNVQDFVIKYSEGVKMRNAVLDGEN